MKRLLSFLALSLALGMGSLAAAADRDLLSIQGLIFGNDGSPVEGPLNVRFRIYDSEESDAALWEETQVVNFQGGVYSASLGSVTPIPAEVYDSQTLFVGLRIEGDSEMKPRMGLFGVPWSQQAEVAVTALSVADGAVTAAALAPGAVTASSLAAAAVGPAELAATGVAAGTYTLATVTVDGDGRITSAANGSAGDITNVTAGDGLSGGGSSGDVGLSAVLGTSIDSSEIVNGAVVDADIGPAAAIAGTKIVPDFGSQDVATTGDVEASGGYKMMIGPFQETDVAASVAKSWEMIEGVGPDEVPIPWAGSVIGVSVKCKPGGGVTAGTLTVEPTISGAETNLEVTLTSASGSNKHGQAAQSKDADPFAAGDLIGCKGTSASLSPTTLDCVCLVFVEM